MPAEVHEFPDEARRPRVKKLRLLLVLGGLASLAVASLAFGMMMAVAAELPGLTSQAELERARNSVLVDYRGQELGIVQGPENRILVEGGQISRSMKRAIIAIEDRRFYENDGVDLRGTLRALWQDVLARKAVQGGSTITQQFVKNKLEAQGERTVLNKLRESALAFHLSRKWDKDRVLTEYLNTIYFGNGAYGIESAARTYFGNQPQHAGCGQRGAPTCASQLTPAEAALVAGVVASPSGYDPVSEPVAAEQRRNLVLRRMLEQGMITRAQHAEARTTSLPTSAQITPPRERAATPQTPYFATWVEQQVVERFGARQAFGGGLRVETTLDLDLQRKAEETVQRWLGNPAGPAAALVALDNETGEVRAMVGGRDFDRSPFNLATQGRRQPGSAFKPFVLAAALDEGIGPGSVWSSRKKAITDRAAGCDFEVNNYEDAYTGSATLEQATATSDNSVYAEVGLKVGLRRIARLARRMGIRTPVSRNCAMTLGGLRQGVTPLDMAYAYSTLARRGRRVTGTLGEDGGGPVGIREVRRRGEDEAGVENERSSRRVLREDVADTTTRLLAGVVTRGTATRAHLGGFAAGKTGTTENYGDAWFVGYTNRMTVAVWVGYPDRTRSMTTEYRGQPVAGGTYPAEIWRDFMQAADDVVDERVDAERRRQGLPPRPDVPELTAPGGLPVPGVTPAPEPVVPAQPGAPAAPATPPAPAAPVAPAAPAPSQATPAPAPDPAPAPAPAPATPPAPAPAPAAPSGTAAGAASAPAG